MYIHINIKSLEIKARELNVKLGLLIFLVGALDFSLLCA